MRGHSRGVKESQYGETIFKSNNSSRFGTSIGRVYPRWYVDRGLAGRLIFRMATPTMPTAAPLRIFQELFTTYFLPEGTNTPESYLIIVWSLTIHWANGTQWPATQGFQITRRRRNYSIATRILGRSKCPGQRE